MLNHVSGEKNAHALWIKPEKLYAQKTGNNKMYLMKRLIRLRYRDDTRMIDHLNTFQGLINQLATTRVKFDEKVPDLWLLGILPNSWETFRMSLSNSTLDGEMTMEIAKSSVLNVEMRRKS